MRQNFSKTKISTAFAILLIGVGLCAPKPAQAITTEEFLRLLGVFGRYADDLNRNFGSGYRQPDPQALPTSEPSNPFNPTSSPPSQPVDLNWP
jgi:hypothetical protein